MECARLHRTELLTSNARQNGSLLNGGRLLETVSVDAAEKLLFQVHVVETGDDLIPVAFDHTIWVHAGGGIVVLRLLTVFRAISVAVRREREREREGLVNCLRALAEREKEREELPAKCDDEPPI